MQSITKQIESATKEKQNLERTLDKLEKASQDNDASASKDVKDQTKELKTMNEKYRIAVSEKVEKFNNHCENLRQLLDRQAKFVSNEVSLTKVKNEIKLLKLEISQKEQFINDFQKGDSSMLGGDDSKKKERIHLKQNMIATLKKEVNEKEFENQVLE